MSLPCAPFLRCLVLATCAVTCVSSKGSLDRFRNYSLDKSTSGDTAQDLLYANITDATNDSQRHEGISQTTPDTERDSPRDRSNHLDPRAGDDLEDQIGDTSEDRDKAAVPSETSVEDEDQINASNEKLDSKRLGDSSVESPNKVKSRKSTTISSPISSRNNPLHDALMNREINIVDAKQSKADSEEDPDIDLPAQVDKEKKHHHRKKRLNSSSSTPSAQLIILVVGAVLSCVIITGFIRWRVRRRLNAKKLRQMSDDYSTKRGKKEFPKKSLMDTIYECDCEYGVKISVTRDTGILAYSEVSQDDDESSRLDEDSSSHRCDPTPSVSGTSCCDVCSYDQLLPLRSSKHGKYSPKGHRKHHGHKSRSPKHHRRSHDRKHACDIETINIEGNIPRIEITKSPSSSLEESDETDTQNPCTGPKTLTPSSVSPLLRQASPHPPRRVLGSLVDTWRSLSFNRDWVGRMWQEKHGVRRISDLLRGLATISEPEGDVSTQDSLSVQVDMEQCFTISPLSEEADASITVHNERGSENSICATSNETCDNTTSISLLPEVEPSELSTDLNLSNENSLPVVESDLSMSRHDYHMDTNNSFGLVEAEPSQMSRTGPLNRFMSLSDNLDEPPCYSSLLDSGHYSMNSLTRSGVEHPRHHRIHRRKHRDRNSRHLYSRVHEDDQGQTSHDDEATSYTPEDLEPSSSIHRTIDQLPVSNRALSVEPSTCDSDSMAVSNCPTAVSQGQPKVHSPYQNSAANVSSPGIVGPFGCQQEGIVIEQLSDGAQIIYLPPPALPSYHNDTPPPYHQ